MILSGGSRPRKDVMGVVLLANGLDEALAVQLPDTSASKRSVDTQAFAYRVWSHQLHLGYLRHQLVKGRLVEHHRIVQLVLALALGPLLSTSGANRAWQQRMNPRISATCHLERMQAVVGGLPTEPTSKA